MNMKPNKKTIETAVANGSMARMNMLLSAAHILSCEANSLIEEASEVMAMNGLLLGSLKKTHTDLLRCADRYFKEFSTLVTTEKAKMDMFSDFDDFDKSFRKWAKIPTGWKPTKQNEV